MTRFLEEVNQQPEALGDLIRFYKGEGAGLLDRWRELLEKYDRLVFCGMGTSEHSPHLIRNELLRLGKSVSIFDAGEYLHYLADSATSDTLYILISQSGESAETKKVTQALSGKEAVVVVANTEDSTMAALAGLFLPLKAGEETSVTNKTYLNTLALLYLMAGGPVAKLEDLASWLGDSYNEEEIIRAAELLMPGDSIHLVARGPALAGARQLALTMMEGAKTNASFFTGGAFRHGPFEVLGERHRAVCLAAEGKTSGLMLAMAREIASAGSRVVLITDLPDVKDQENMSTIRVRSFSDEMLFPPAITMVQNYLVHHVARLRGLEAGVFDRVTKVTTVE